MAEFDLADDFTGPLTVGYDLFMKLKEKSEHPVLLFAKGTRANVASFQAMAPRAPELMFLIMRTEQEFAKRSDLFRDHDTKVYIPKPESHRVRDLEVKVADDFDHKLQKAVDGLLQR